MIFRITILMLLLIPCTFALEWSEIMFNPIGNDNNREYILLTGTDSLDGCILNDSSSSDKLVLLHTGSEQIAILESDSELLNQTINHTVYTLGAAIGNGLGNTAENITITCNSSVLATIYSVTDVTGFDEGMSIVYNNGWKLGPMNGTLGQHHEPNISSNISTPPTFIDVSDSYENVCNDTLLITTSANKGMVGENVSFTIVSSAFTTYEIHAEKQLIAKGDNLQQQSYIFTLPDEDKVKITAYSTACGREQRSSRIITIVPVPPQVEVVTDNASVVVAVQPEPVTEAVVPQPEPTEPIVQEVVLDKDRSMVPWICVFGAITLLVSTKVFFAIKNEG